MLTRLGQGVLAAMIFLCVSCGDNAELTKRSQQLDADIAEIEEHLADIRRQLRAEVVDVSAEYDVVEQKLDQAKKDAARLETELLELRDDKESLELRFSNYRNKYPIN